MSNKTPTLLITHALLAKLFDLKNPVNPITTLNTKHDILKNETTLNKSLLQYFALGNGSHTSTNMEGSQITRTQLHTHSTADTGLYNQIPFAMVKTTDPIPSHIKDNHRLKKIIEKNGVEYHAFYLKKLNPVNKNIQTKKLHVKDGVTEIDDFVHTEQNASPIKTLHPNNKIVAADGDYISTYITVDIVFDKNTINDLSHVFRILFDVEGDFDISEIALCTGEEKTQPDGSIEAIGVQVLYFYCSREVLSIDGTRTLSFDVGSIEAL